MHNLTTTEGTLAYLTSTRFVATDIQLLTGGRSAFTYRAVLKTPLPTGEKTVVLKHSEQYGALFDTVNVEVERASFEYKALTVLASSGLFHSNSVVQVPKPIHYDPDTHAIFMTDLGTLSLLSEELARSLENAQASHSDSPSSPMFEEALELASNIGSAIGDFLGRFHNWTALPEQATLRAYFSRNVAAKQALAFHHECMMQSAHRLSNKARYESMGDFLAKARAETSMEGCVLAMGEFWLDNILVSPEPDVNNLRLYIVDWETVRPASPELDIGEITGTTVSFAVRYGVRDLYTFIPAFHQAYRRHRSLSPVQVAAMTGAYAMGLSTVLSWSKDQSEEYLRAVVMTGTELLKLAWSGDEKVILEQDTVKYLFLPESQPSI